MRRCALPGTARSGSRPEPIGFDLSKWDAPPYFDSELIKRIQSLRRRLVPSRVFERPNQCGDVPAAGREIDDRRAANYPGCACGKRCADVLGLGNSEPKNGRRCACFLE